MKRFITLLPLLLVSLLVLLQGIGLNINRFPVHSSATESGISLTATMATDLPSDSNIPKPSADTHEIQILLDIIFGLVGALSLLMITISGVRYIISSGDSQKTARAKEGIIYSLVGLALAIFAEAIVAFVVGRIS